MRAIREPTLSHCIDEDGPTMGLRTKASSLDAFF